MTDLAAKEAATRAAAAGRVNLMRAAVEWVKHNPPGFYTKGKLSRELAETYGGDPVVIRTQVIAPLVRCGALLWEKRPDRSQRKRLIVGHGDWSRARVRADTNSLVGPPHSSNLPKRPDTGKVGRIRTW